jgi:superfamily II DNA or RNA helicase
MTVSLESLQISAEVEFFDYQHQALVAAMAQPGPSQRLCLYYKTGAGKSLTALGCVRLWGYSEVVVIAPPSTHDQWEKLGAKLNITIETMSHAKFRQPSTLLSRTKPVIADEMHLFGDHAGKGWKKLDKLAMHLKAPLVLASATPNYNDAERVYCIQHILDPHSVKGGYLAFVYAHCVTRENPFGRTPHVDGFLHFADAASYLAALPKVEYLPDDLVYQIQDVGVVTPTHPELDEFGLDSRRGRIIASQMEERHARINLALSTDTGTLRDHVYAAIQALVDTSPTPVLIFATHATVAEALSVSLHLHKVTHGVIHGGVSKKVKQQVLDLFLAGDLPVLVGTASLATGTDGLDKVCDRLIILDDTDDDSLRRQLIGRIMPRGAVATGHTNEVYRFIPTASSP